MALVPQKINDLAAAAELLDSHQFETDIGGVTPNKITGLQLKDALQSVPPADTIRVEPGVGSDITGDGTPQKPYETYDFAQSTLPPGGLKLIATEGSGFINQNITITRDFTFIVATGIVLNPSSGDVITINSPGSSSIGYRFGGVAPQSGNAINIISASGSAADVPIIAGDIIASTGAHTIATLNFAGDVTGPGLIYINDIGGGSSALPDNTSLFGRSKDKWYGSMIFYRAVRHRMSSRFVVNASITVSELHAGQSLFCRNGGGIAITLPEESTLALPDGWQFDITRAASGTVGIITQGSDFITGLATLPSIGSKATVTKFETIAGVTEWIVGQ